jgi:hypothetical protein
VTIVSLAVLVSMNVQLAQSLKVISILSTQTLVQNVALVLMHVRLKQLAWANTIRKGMTNGCLSQRDGRFYTKMKHTSRYAIQHSGGMLHYLFVMNLISAEPMLP